MPDRVLLKIAVPMVAISLLLLGMGAVAAWNVQRQQAISSNLIVREVEGMLAAQDVYIGMREIRHQLNQYLRNHNRGYLDAISEIHNSTEKRLKEAKDLARAPEEQQLISVVDDGYRRFWDSFQQINSAGFPDDRDRALGVLIDDVLTREILEPGEQYINYASRHSSDQMRQGFLLLGICGGAGGLVAGLGIARAVSQSIVRLDVSVRSAAGKLNSVVGPVTFSRSGDFDQLEAGLQTMERHIAEIVERLERSELEVLRNEQLAAVGQLAAGIAHELRNPLMPIKILVQAALDRGDDRGLHGRQLEVVEEEIEQLERSIQMFLDFARPRELEKAQVDVVGIAEQTLDLVAGKAERQEVTIHETLPDEAVWIDADSGQIRQILLNLMLNALEALPEGGRIEVQIERSESAGVAGEGPGGRATIRVADNGPGLPAALLERIFDPFVTTKETGTGLGLSVCKRMTEAHGGSIIAGNREGGGAEFVVTLPCSGTNGAPPAAGPGRASAIAPIRTAGGTM
jgi:two-component system, NtrC family, sensor histidine kinase HydH